MTKYKSQKVGSWIVETGELSSTVQSNLPQMSLQCILVEESDGCTIRNSKRADARFEARRCAQMTSYLVVNHHIFNTLSFSVHNISLHKCTQSILFRFLIEHILKKRFDSSNWFYDVSSFCLRHLNTCFFIRMKHICNCMMPIHDNRSFNFKTLLRRWWLYI